MTSRSEAKPHTPGPWSVPHFAKPKVNCACGYVLTDGYMGAVCTVHASGKGDWQRHGDNPRFEEACANAYLIAAAPEMFSALVSIVSYLENGETTDWIYARDLARAAITKAKGEESNGSSPKNPLVLKGVGIP